MLYITKTVGYQCAVYDSDDGTIEWIPKEDIVAAKKRGFQFEVREITLEKEQCNFGVNKANIFANPYRITKSCGVYTIISCGKKLKFKVEGEMLHFNIGVYVPLKGVSLC